jgi:hypothetical protein
MKGYIERKNSPSLCDKISAFVTVAKAEKIS